MLLIDEEDTSSPREATKYRESPFPEAFWKRAYAESSAEDQFVDDIDWRELPGRKVA